MPNIGIELLHLVPIGFKLEPQSLTKWPSPSICNMVSEKLKLLLSPPLTYLGPFGQCVPIFSVGVFDLFQNPQISRRVYPQIS